jgi:UDP-2,4-diacetamido-2,4,6-trideoxy-beta-L-altropyranose hydrolase
LNKLRILFRVDANSALGLGHLMRCLVLAEAFRSRGHSCAFLSLDSDINLLDILKSRGYKPQDLLNQSSFGNNICLEKNKEFQESNYNCIKFGLEYMPNILVVDHYWIDYEWESYFKNYDIKILVIDDLAKLKHNCDYLVHQTNVMSKKSYSNLTPPSTQILTGFQFMLLSTELQMAKSHVKDVPLRARNILVAFGFSDPNSLTVTIGTILSSITFDMELKVTILAGKSSILRKVEQSLSSKTQNEVNILPMTSSLDIIEVIKQTDYAFTAGGLLSIELAYLGVPCTVIPSSEIQYDVAQALGQKVNNNVIRASFTDYEIVQHLRTTLEKQKHNGQRTFHPDIDGLGAKRLAERVLLDYE